MRRIAALMTVVGCALIGCRFITAPLGGLDPMHQRITGEEGGRLEAHLNRTLVFDLRVKGYGKYGEPGGYFTEALLYPNDSVEGFWLTPVYPNRAPSGLPKTYTLFNTAIDSIGTAKVERHGDRLKVELDAALLGLPDSLQARYDADRIAADSTNSGAFEEFNGTLRRHKLPA